MVFASSFLGSASLLGSASFFFSSGRAPPVPRLLLNLSFDSSLFRLIRSFTSSALFFLSSSFYLAPRVIILTDAACLTWVADYTLGLATIHSELAWKRLAANIRLSSLALCQPVPCQSKKKYRKYQRFHHLENISDFRFLGQRIFLENRYRILAGNICLEGKTSAANTRKTLI